jgi:uncharacterized protein YjbI with pentapeptide repeats
MAVTRDTFTEGRLRQRLGADPPRTESGAYDLRGANLARLSLSKARLEEADLTRANLRGADLQRARLERAVLIGADLSEALLQDADLSGADLRSACLHRAVLDGTRVKDARLGDTDFEGARLRNVALWETGLTPADVAGAASIELAGFLRGAPGDLAVEEWAAWCGLVGRQPEQWALRDALKEAAWRPWRELLRQTLRDLDGRLGALSEASLSRAAPRGADERSLSRAADPQSTPTERSVSWLKAWRQSRRDEP